MFVTPIDASDNVSFSLRPQQHTALTILLKTHPAKAVYRAEAMLLASRIRFRRRLRFSVSVAIFLFQVSAASYVTRSNQTYSANFLRTEMSTINARVRWRTFLIRY